MIKFSDQIQDENDSGASANTWRHFEEIDEKDLSPEQLDLLNCLRQKISEASFDFKEKFWSAIKENAQSQKAVLSKKVLDFLKENFFDQPLFEVAFGESAILRLQELGFKERQFENDSFLVIFQLPKPLQKFWHKYETFENNFNERLARGKRGASISKDDPRRIHQYPRQELQPAIIEWGFVYGEMISLIRKMIRDFNNSNVPGYFHRISEWGEHNGEYFYTWEVNLRYLGVNRDAADIHYYDDQPQEEDADESGGR